MSHRRTPLPGESTPEEVLSVLEVPGADGSVRFRISRYCSADGSHWVRHGPFAMLHPNGAIATEGRYRDGIKEGRWRDYYETGQIAAEGEFVKGKEEGSWRFWRRDGTEQPSVEYVNGEEVRRCPRGSEDN